MERKTRIGPDGLEHRVVELRVREDLSDEQVADFCRAFEEASWAGWREQGVPRLEPVVPVYPVRFGAELDVLKERERQRAEHPAEEEDGYYRAELLHVAVELAGGFAGSRFGESVAEVLASLVAPYKSADPRQSAVAAAAFLIAEVERIDREAARHAAAEGSLLPCPFCREGSIAHGGKVAVTRIGHASLPEGGSQRTIYGVTCSACGARVERASFAPADAAAAWNRGRVPEPIPAQPDPIGVVHNEPRPMGWSLANPVDHLATDEELAEMEARENAKRGAWGLSREMGEQLYPCTCGAVIHQLPCPQRLLHPHGNDPRCVAVNEVAGRSCCLGVGHPGPHYDLRSGVQWVMLSPTQSALMQPRRVEPVPIETTGPEILFRIPYAEGEPSMTLELLFGGDRVRRVAHVLSTEEEFPSVEAEGAVVAMGPPAFTGSISFDTTYPTADLGRILHLFRLAGSGPGGGVLLQYAQGVLLNVFFGVRSISVSDRASTVAFTYLRRRNGLELQKLVEAGGAAVRVPL